VEEEDVFAAVARECKEEAGLTLDPKLFRPFWFCSSAPRPNRVLLFSAYSSVLDVDAVKKDLRPTAEMTDFQVIHRDFQASEFAFPLHAQAAKKFFDQKD
jgi:8-oxo-dGTP pyrophosphatase MutT (NUDIX family)